MSDPHWLTDAEFGRAFLRRAVTRPRLEAALASLATKQFRIGPISSGPIGLASVAAEGRLEPATVGEPDEATYAFPVTVPAALDLAVKVGVATKLHADVRIDLTLTPRAAAPLLLVVDLAPVRAVDVRITWQGTGLAAAVTNVLEAVTDELRGQVARQVRSALNGRGARRARTFDIAARLAGRKDDPTPETYDWIDEAAFGRAFLEHAVTRERVEKGARSYAGQEIAIGPLRTGPGKAVTVHAEGRIGEPAVTDRPGGYGARLPVRLDLVVDVARANRYAVDVDVPLQITPRAAAPLHIVIDIQPVSPQDVRADITAHGAVAGLVGRLGNLDGQLRRQVAKTVNKRLADPSTRTIDVGAKLDNLDVGKRSRRPRPT
jgi:hypothetical protein